MDLTHAHLFLNHIPVVGLFFSSCLLVHAIRRQNSETEHLALIFFLLLSLSSLPVYFTGEPAEDAVAFLPGLTNQVEWHEKSAKFALAATLAMGVLAGLLLWEPILIKKSRKTYFRLFVAMAVLAQLLLLWTAYCGGQIRHSEIRSEAKTP